MTLPSTQVLTIPGSMLRRGFWLYVWRAETPFGELLYVGRTGDNSSPFATAPYSRMGQHLGHMKAQNALRRHLNDRAIEPEDCGAFHLVAHGPLYPEVDTKLEREDRWQRHIVLRNIVGAMEKALALCLHDAGYVVMNSVKWRHELDRSLWEPVYRAFVVHFPNLPAELRPLPVQ